jgi:hypothetical protein
VAYPRDLGCVRKHLLELHRRLLGNALLRLDRNPLGDAVAEADEVYQNTGEKGIPHDDMEGPPRRRANGRRGQGKFANDWPVGVVGRESGEVRLEVPKTASGAKLDEVVKGTCLGGAVGNTDEWSGYSHGGRRPGWFHRAVDHSRSRSGYEVDADGERVREVHCNTMEGLWTGARNFLCPFFGVSMWYEDRYLAIFQWGHDLKRMTDRLPEGSVRISTEHRVRLMSLDTHSASNPSQSSILPGTPRDSRFNDISGFFGRQSR